MSRHAHPVRMFLLALGVVSLVLGALGSAAGTSVANPQRTVATNASGLVRAATPTPVPAPPTPVPPNIPAACQGNGWSGATIVYLTPAQNPYTAGNGKNIIFGTASNDTIIGGNGKDCILGLGGNDTISGNNSDDHIDGGDGTDQCNGGSGTNTILNCESTGSASIADTNGAGTSTPTPAPAPAAPSGLAATVEAKTVKLSWNTVEGAAYYNVYRSDTHGSGYEGIGSATTPAFSDSDVKVGQTYYYVVTAVGPTKAQSRESNEASGTVASATSAPTSTGTATHTPTSAPTATPTATAAATATHTATATPTATGTATPKHQ